VCLFLCELLLLLFSDSTIGDLLAFFRLRVPLWDGSVLGPKCFAFAPASPPSFLFFPCSLKPLRHSVVQLSFLTIAQFFFGRLACFCARSGIRFLASRLGLAPPPSPTRRFVLALSTYAGCSAGVWNASLVFLYDLATSVSIVSRLLFFSVFSHFILFFRSSGFFCWAPPELSSFSVLFCPFSSRPEVFFSGERCPGPPLRLVFSVPTTSPQQTSVLWRPSCFAAPPGPLFRFHFFPSPWATFQQGLCRFPPRPFFCPLFPLPFVCNDRWRVLLFCFFESSSFLFWERPPLSAGPTPVFV